MRIFEFIDSMSNVKRWNQSKCMINENVLEHTAFVSIYSMYICDKHGLNPENAVLMAICHDMEEVLTGDIPTPTKHHSIEMKAMCERIAEDAAGEISDSIFFGHMFGRWLRSKELSSIDGFIVQLSDSAAIVYKIWQEVTIGNRNFLQYSDRIIEKLESLKMGKYTFLQSDIDELINIVRKLNESA